MYFLFTLAVVYIMCPPPNLTSSLPRSTAKISEVILEYLLEARD